LTAKVLWEPTSGTIERAKITAYSRWLEGRVDSAPTNFPELWRWSVEELEDFWESMWIYYGVRSTTPYVTPLEHRSMPGARWFPGATLNYAERVFEGRDSSRIAIISKTEETTNQSLSWGQLRSKTAAFSESLRELGVGRGDRVAAYLPNVPEAVISYLACASIGATWSSCAPDFGTTSAVDRFKQIAPKVLIATEGYSYRGKWNNKKEVVGEIISAIPSIQKVVSVGEGKDSPGGALHWDDLAARPSSSKFEFEGLPFDHPLCILYSSGTTGLPKPIVHGHGGILLEHLKTLGIHNDLGPDDRMFWYSSTGWMMWNYLVSSLALDSTVILYEGDPFYPDADALWSLADSTDMTFLGASAAYVGALMKSGVEPASTHTLRHLRGFGSTGSALSSDAFEWIYGHVKPDIWLASVSGGTDLCTAFVGGCPILPVRSGEIQCRNLGADVAAFDAQGREVVGEMGELVIKQPMPSMPLFLWGDASGERYNESYFSVYPGIWRHGDWIQVNPDGSCIIFGRSDATIKRMGVRMGTSEIYRVVESIPEISDSLVVDMEFLGGRSYMPLFVVIRQGKDFEAVRNDIRGRIRKELSPKMLPDDIIVVDEVPRTLNGKKLEVPIRRILLGADPSKVYNPGSLKNPRSMEFFIEFAKTHR
jgi:acetoacetyl-CoA synthetase